MFRRRRSRGLSPDEVLERAFAEAERVGMAYAAVLKAMIDSVDDPGSPLRSVVSQPASEWEADLAQVFISAALMALERRDQQTLVEVGMVGAGLMVVWDRHMRRIDTAGGKPPPPMGSADNGVDLLREAVAQVERHDRSIYLQELDWQLFRVALGTSDALVRPSTNESFGDVMASHQAEAGALLIEALILAATEADHHTLTGVFDVLPILLMRLERAIEAQRSSARPWN